MGQRGFGKRLRRREVKPKKRKIVRIYLFTTRLLKKLIFMGCSKMPRCKAPEILRSEAYLEVRRNEEG